MRQFVHERELRAPREDGVDVHLLQNDAAILQGFAGDDLQTGQQGQRLQAPVGFDDADRDIDAFRFAGLRVLEHGVGLAHAGAHAEKNLELAAFPRPFLTLDRGEQGIGIWPSQLGHGNILTRCQGNVITTIDGDGRC